MFWAGIQPSPFQECWGCRPCWIEMFNEWLPVNSVEQYLLLVYSMVQRKINNLPVWRSWQKCWSTSRGASGMRMQLDGSQDPIPAPATVFRRAEPKTELRTRDWLPRPISHNSSFFGWACIRYGSQFLLEYLASSRWTTKPWTDINKAEILVSSHVTSMAAHSRARHWLLACYLQINRCGACTLYGVISKKCR